MGREQRARPGRGSGGRGGKEPAGKGAAAPSTPRVRVLVLSALGLIGCALLAVGVLVAHYRSWAEGAIGGIDAESGSVVVIAQGGSFGDAVETLEEAGLVTHPLYFRFMAQRSGLDRSIRAGTYTVDAGTTPRQLLALLARGGADGQVRLVVPEGFNIFKIADRLEALGLANREVFLTRVQSREVRERYGVEDGDSLEGYLYPDTYLLRQGTSADVIIDRMVQRHREVWASLVEEVGEAKVRSLLSLYDLKERDLITLASIVEKETRSASERPIIARVFYNRLQKGMRLQTDPTCVYNREWYKLKPHPRYCRDRANRYSTYVIDGLPPGPIASPGRASLRAVLTPTEKAGERDYLYFVTRNDGSGRHRFSKEYKDHQKAIRRAFRRADAADAE